MSGGRTAEVPGPMSTTAIVVLPRTRAAATIWGEWHPAVASRRRWPENNPQHAVALHDSWWTVAAAGLLTTVTLGGALWIADHLDVDRQLHTVSLFIHLAALVLGFGGVLIADYLMLVWLAGRSTLAEALAGVARLHVPIWVGLVGLVASGCLLEPNLGSAMTRTKMAFVLILTLNGLQALLLGKRLTNHVSIPLTTRLLLWGAASGAISQICWWGAIGIGFWNAEH